MALTHGPVNISRPARSCGRVLGVVGFSHVSSLKQQAAPSIAKVAVNDKEGRAPVSSSTTGRATAGGSSTAGLGTPTLAQMLVHPWR